MSFESEIGNPDNYFSDLNLYWQLIWDQYLNDKILQKFPNRINYKTYIVLAFKKGFLNKLESKLKYIKNGTFETYYNEEMLKHQELTNNKQELNKEHKIINTIDTIDTINNTKTIKNTEIVKDTSTTSTPTTSITTTTSTTSTPTTIPTTIPTPIPTPIVPITPTISTTSTELETHDSVNYDLKFNNVEYFKIIGTIQNVGWTMNLPDEMGSTTEIFNTCFFNVLFTFLLQTIFKDKLEKYSVKIMYIKLYTEIKKMCVNKGIKMPKQNKMLKLDKHQTMIIEICKLYNINIVIFQTPKITSQLCLTRFYEITSNTNPYLIVVSEPIKAFAEIVQRLPIDVLSPIVTFSLISQ